MGAEAIKELLKKVDLGKEIEDIRKKLETAQGQKRTSLLKSLDAAPDNRVIPIFMRPFVSFLPALDPMKVFTLLPAFTNPFVRLPSKLKLDTAYWLSIETPTIFCGINVAGLNRVRVSISTVVIAFPRKPRTT